MVSSLLWLGQGWACAGCGVEQTIVSCGGTFDPVSRKCMESSDSGGVQRSDTLEDLGAGAADTGAGADTGGPTKPDVSLVSEDPGSFDASPTCSAANPGLGKIGHPCTGHTDCETCYCYDEAYLSPYRFCTKDCSSGGDSACPLGTGDFPEYACVKFTQAQIKDFSLVHTGICTPRCISQSDCKLYGPDWGYCPKSQTTWEDAVVAAVGTCQTTAP